MRDLHIQARVELDRGSYVGAVIDGSGGVAYVSFATDEAPELRVGSALPQAVRFEGGGLAEPITLGGTVASRRDLPDQRVYGLALDDPGRLSRVLPPDQLPQFDRRTWSRARPPSTAAIPVEVIGTAGPGTGVSMRGRLLDISGGGIGLTLDRDAERFLSRSPEVVVRLQRPGQSEVESFGCRIANRMLSDDEIRYGLEFAQLPGADDSPPTGDYQSAWDCAHCGGTLLLGRSHAHCPECGTARGGQPTYFPDWDDLVLDSEHWFTGTDRACAFCKASFSSEARFCGACGKPLV